jgi:hypothetical protein
MTRESLVALSPDAVLSLAKTYFTDPGTGYAGTLIEEGAGFARFEIFRGHLAVSATPDGESTRVRCSTLRYHPSIGKFLVMLETESPVPGV